MNSSPRKTQGVALQESSELKVSQASSGILTQEQNSDSKNEIYDEGDDILVIKVISPKKKPVADLSNGMTVLKTKTQNMASGSAVKPKAVDWLTQLGQARKRKIMTDKSGTNERNPPLRKMITHEKKLEVDGCSVLPSTSEDVSSAALVSRQNSTVLLGPEKEERHSANSDTMPEEELFTSQGIASSQQETVDPTEGEDSRLSDVGTSEIHYSPYYLKFFQNILDEVIWNPWNDHLIQDDDRELFSRFKGLKESQRRLFVRLFLRRRQWLPLDKLTSYEKDVYPDTIVDLLPELCSQKFLESGKDIQCLQTVLNLLDAPKLKVIAKAFKIDVNGKKSDLKASLMSKSVNQRTLFGTCEAVILKRAKAELGHCYRVTEETRLRLAELITLHSPLYMNSSHLIDDPRANLIQQLLYQHLQVDKGEVLFPTYSINKSKDFDNIFSTRTDLSSFCKAMDSEARILLTILTKANEEAFSIFEGAKTKITELISRSTNRDHIAKHLRGYCAQAVYARVIWHGIELLQKRRRYSDAVTELEALLDLSPDLGGSSRGRWWDRLALNLHSHLKQPKKALTMIEKAFKDERLTGRWKLALYDRAEKIVVMLKGRRRSAKLKRRKRKQITVDDDEDEDEDSDNDDDNSEFIDFSKLCYSPPAEPKSHSISGTTMSKGLVDGVKTIFLDKLHSSDGSPDGGVNRCSVETVALNHYVKKGFLEGIHGEGGPFLAIFGILFWEQIFDDAIPGSFLFKYQMEPLDYRHSSCFYPNRKKQLDERLDWLASASSKEIEDAISDAWPKYEGTTTTIVSWNVFVDFDQCQRLAGCLGGSFLSIMFRYLMEDIRERHSGIPDLVVWNAKTKKFKIIEVKGPGDRLSTKQRIWLDFFTTKCGADAEVCYVEGKGSRQL